MSDKTRLEELLGQQEILRSVGSRYRELLEEVEGEMSKVNGRLHRKSIRKRKWLYVKTNAWQHAGIKYGAKLKVQSIGTKWVKLLYRGRWYSFRPGQVATEKPSNSSLNNNFANFFIKVDDPI